jgi:hypothetical protein
VHINDEQYFDGVRRRVRPSLLGLLAADRRDKESGAIPPQRHSREWLRGEEAVLDRFARLVRDGRYSNAVLAVEPCRAALQRLRRRTDPSLAPRTRSGIHRQLILRARAQGRPRIRVRWHEGELAVLDRFARAVAAGRFKTARGAGRACQEALSRLHARYPKKYAGVHERSLATLQHRIWPRVARLRYRWYNSQWASEERALVDRYAAAVVAHRFPHIRAAARACQAALNRLHRRHGGVAGVRTLGAVFDQVFDRAHALNARQLPHRWWTPEERRVARSWMLRYDRHRRGRSRMNLHTAAEMMRAELGRMGYYRNQQACVAEIWTQRAAMLGCPRRSARQAVRRR